MSITKILWISPCAPSRSASHAGGQTFFFYFEKFVKDPAFSVKLICSDNDLDYNELSNILPLDSLRVINSKASKFKKITNVESELNPWNRHAGMLSNYYSKEIRKFCLEYKNSGYLPDVIILEWTAIVLMSDEIRSIFPSAKLVASEADVTYIGYYRKHQYYTGIKKLIWKHKYKWEKKCELASLNVCDLIMPHNPDNIDLLKGENIAPEKLLWLTPYFYNMSGCSRHSNNRDILFYGAMGRVENHLTAMWIIKNILPLVDDLDVRFVFLGSHPQEELKSYISDRVCVTGFVKDVNPYFESSVCLLAPLVLGAGIKVKILEGLSSGIPVITNDIGIEGIPAKPDYEYIHCNSAEEYATAIRNACSGGLDAVGLAGKKFIADTYNFHACYESYKNAIINLSKVGE